MRIDRALLVVVLLATASVDVATQEQTIQIIRGGPPGEGMQMPGMGPRQVKTGTGRIKGQVAATDTGAPIRRAQVRVSGPDIGTKTAMTDAEGRYEFRELPAGRFTLMATKAGYVNVQYGQTRPFESGRPIELADKQELDKADISMPRGSVISGRIVDEFGEPLADVMVSALRQTWSGGRRRLVPAGGRVAQTNDLGQFRMYGLPPGEYYVTATLRGVETLMMDMAPGAGGPVGSTPASGYAPTYFPGTSSAAEAQKITLVVGQEAQGTEFALTPVKLARITGTVVNSEGKPVEGAMITAVPATRGTDVGMFMMGGGARSSKDGAFTLSGVTPGDYTLQARSIQTITSGDGDRMVFTATMGPGGGDDSEFASVPVSVAGEDLPGLVIVTAKGGTAAGKVTFEGAKPTSLTGIRISAPPADFDGPPMAGGGAGGQLKPDATFELKGLAGAKLIRVGGLPQGWMLKSVTMNGTDVTDTGLTFKSGENVSGLEVVLTPKVTEVNGGVTGTDGSPVKEYTVVIFSDDPEKWTAPMTRWVAASRPDQEGRFIVRNLPPGSYQAAVVDYVEQGGWGDPELLERLKASAHQFTLTEGETETLALKMR